MGIESNSTPSYDKWSLGSSVFNGIASFGGGDKGSLGTGFDTDDANRTDLPYAAGAAGSFSPCGGGAAGSL